MENDNRQLQRHLRQFRPVEPEPRLLPFPQIVGLKWPRRLACAAAVVLLIGTGIWLDAHSRSNPPAHTAHIAADLGARSHPLTIRRANAMLFESSSVSNGLDEISFSQKPPMPVGRQSVLSILGEEKTKL